MKRYGRNQKRQHRQRIVELEALVEKLRGPWKRGTHEPSLEGMGFVMCSERLEESTERGMKRRVLTLEGVFEKGLEPLYKFIGMFRTVQWDGMCYILERCEMRDRDALPAVSLTLFAIC